MTCISCREALTSEPKKCRSYCVTVVNGGDFHCEDCGDANGPGPVDDQEILYSIVFDPQQVFADGTLRPTACMQVDFGGLSTLRESAEDEEFLLTVAQIRGGSGEAQRDLYGVSQFRASAVRNKQGERLMGVYDTPQAGKPNHVDVLAPYIGMNVSIGPNLSQGRRTTLQKMRLLSINEIIGRIILSSMFRDGLLNDA